MTLDADTDWSEVAECWPRATACWPRSGSQRGCTPAVRRRRAMPGRSGHGRALVATAYDCAAFDRAVGRRSRWVPGGSATRPAHNEEKRAMAKLAEGIRIVDADSHMTERHDLFTERAPKGFEDKVPHVVKIDGMDMWVIDGHTFGKAGSGGTIDRDGKKHPCTDSQGGSWGIDDVHRSAWDPAARLEDDGRVRHRLPGHLSERDRHRRAEPRQHGEGSRARAAVRPALQRRAGRGAGGVEQPPPPHADHAGVEHRGVRASRRSAARRWGTAA